MSSLRAPTIPAAAAHVHTDRCPTCDQPIPREMSETVKQRIAGREREQAVRIRVEVEARARSEIEAAATAARLEADARLAEAEQAKAAAERQLTALKSEHEALIARRLGELREAAEREKIAAVQAEQTKAFEEKQKLQAKMAEMQRQLESKTAQELGEGAEIDLFELLKAEFPGDRITRVDKGVAGADVVHDIVHNSRTCGRIVYDSKNRSAWRNDYVAKLRQDQIEAKADHAVLASKVFPSGMRELHIQEGVLVVAPARVLIIAGLLRRHLVQTSALRLSNEARAQKTEQLYAFIMSERCGQLMSSIATRASDMEELDRKEVKAHEATWKRRGELIRAVQRAHGDLSFEIERIIGVAGNRPHPDEED